MRSLHDALPILVRVRAAAVNPTDTYVRKGDRERAQRKQSPPPYVPGMDVAGVLEAIGPGVDTALSVGDRVMAVVVRSEEHTSELQSLMRNSYAVFCLTKKIHTKLTH